MRLLASLFGPLAKLEENATENHATDAFLSELALSHGDLSNLLRTAVKAQHPGGDVYCWVRDVFDDRVIYEITNKEDVSRLYQRTYTVDDAGAVTLGEPVAVVAVTSYVAATEADRDDLAERSFTQDQRDAMAKSGEAMSDGGFPIATKGDLKNAISAYGRADNKPAVKRHIIKRAKALNATDLLPADWAGSTKQESEAEDITTDLVPLVEKAVKKDGTSLIKIIAPGQGSSGYYPAEVLQRDGPRVFAEGTHIYLDHPSISDEANRPERSVRDLAGSLTGPAEWREDGLYAPVKFIDSVAPHINAIAAISGMSIRAAGKAGTREIDGKKVRSIESIDVAHSVDVVTKPGAGGKVMDLIESARNGRLDPSEEDEDMSKEELEEAQRELAELKQWKLQQEQREASAALLTQARTVIVATLKPIAMPDMVRDRLTEQLAANPPTKDGALDRETLATKVTEAATAELDYLAKATGGGGQVRGMGGGAPTTPEIPTLEESGKRIEAALAAF